MSIFNKRVIPLGVVLALVLAAGAPKSAFARTHNPRSLLMLSVDDPQKGGQQEAENHQGDQNVQDNDKDVEETDKDVEEDEKDMQENDNDAQEHNANAQNGDKDDQDVEDRDDDRQDDVHEESISTPPGF